MYGVSPKDKCAMYPPKCMEEEAVFHTFVETTEALTFQAKYLYFMAVGNGCNTFTDGALHRFTVKNGMKL